MTKFAEILRHWRAIRRMSQLALAGEAGISARHLAFLETGRAQPSRRMVLTLAETLEVPNADTNRLLQAAGFADHFPAHVLADDDMAGVRQAMDWTISRHAPYPALVMDRLWVITALNAPAERLFGPMGFGVGTSLLAVLDGPVAPADFIENWGEVAHHTMMRLRMESARAGGIAELDRAAERLTNDPAVKALKTQPKDSAVLSTIYRAGPLRLALFSIYAGFGSAQEVALSEMKIELMFPADTATENLLINLGKTTGKMASNG
ncbi:MAG: helix-turn-helix domain-containing protein [Deltaproteobacteria bacterium]